MEDYKLRDLVVMGGGLKKKWNNSTSNASKVMSPEPFLLSDHILEFTVSGKCIENPKI